MRLVNGHYFLFQAGSGPLVGIARYDGTVVTAAQSGVLTYWNCDNKISLDCVEIREHEVTSPATANGRERGNRTNVNCEGGRGGQIWFGWLIDFSSPNLPTNHIYLHF